MTNATWIEALAHELQARGLDAAKVAAVVVEAEGHLQESTASALVAFGPPAAYADQVADAVDPPRRRDSDVGPVRVRVVGAAKSYGRQVVLNGVDLEVRAGQVVALIGPNGCGKSSLLRVIAGLEAADLGTVAVEGSVGYVPQQGGLVANLSADEHFVLFGAAHGLDRSSSRRRGVQLGRELGWEPDHHLVRDLSGGTRQKLSVVLALLGDPDVLLLDEPYQGFDPDSTYRFWELLWGWTERGGSALVVSHTEDVFRKASAVVELEGARR